MAVTEALKPAPQNTAPPATESRFQLDESGREIREFTLANVWNGLPFYAIHVLPFLAIWTGTHWVDWAVCFGLYFVRMFAVTGVYHRYFSHRTFKTSRVFQFFLAFLAQTSAQKGVLWWAAHHRHHHKHSDDEVDTHSPVTSSLFYAHLGWMFMDANNATDFSKIKDFAKYPELRFLNRYYLLPPIVLAVGIWLALGWSGLLIGFFLSTVFLWHGTFVINSLAHVFGSKRFETGDESRNNFWLALITLGEGWHNNHHYYQSSCRQGFYWWEVDVTYYIIRALAAVGLVWDVREPPERVLEDGRRADAAA